MNRRVAKFTYQMMRYINVMDWPREMDFLYFHQNVAREWMADRDTRGLLLYHCTGMGKSYVAAAVAMDCIFPPRHQPSMERTLEVMKHERILSTFMDELVAPDRRSESDRATLARLEENVRAASVPLGAAKPRPVVMLLAKSLGANMRSAMRAYIVARLAMYEKAPELREGSAFYEAMSALASGERIDEWIDENIEFVTLNASNALAQMGRATALADDEYIERKLHIAVKQIGSLDGHLLIVDEAHNLFRAVANGAQNATGLYKMILHARNLKVMFMTGTPIVNDPFEIAPCFNMIAGEEILFMNREDFMKYCVDSSGLYPNNMDRILDRIAGLTSYASDQLAPTSLVAERIAARSSSGKLASVEYPRSGDVIRVNVEMRGEQYEVYLQAREYEQQSSSGDGSGAGATHGSSYRVRSRQIGNYCPPLAVRDARHENARKRETARLVKLGNLRAANGDGQQSSVAAANGSEADVIDTDDAQLLEMCEHIVSPKFDAILERVNARKGQLGLIYSQFVGLGGLMALARYLDQHDYAGKYAVISGAVQPDERADIVARFNAQENHHGEQIALLLVSSTGAEGIDLKCVRHVHILEPYWNQARIEQVRARAIRNHSHSELPPEERSVETFVYIAVAPAHAQHEPSTDEKLFTDAMNSQVLISRFLSLLRRSSIDCSLYTHRQFEPPCHSVTPSEQILFTNDVMADFSKRYAHRFFMENTVPDKKIIYKDKKYVLAHIHEKPMVFVFDPVIGMLRSLRRDNPEYDAIEALLMAQP